LLVAVNVALGLADQSACPASDADRDGAVSIEDLVGGVARSLDGCFLRAGGEAVEDATRIEETTRQTLPQFIILNLGRIGASGGGGIARGRDGSAVEGGGAGEAVPQPCTRGDSRSGTILTTCNRATNTLTTTYAACRLPGEDAIRNGVERRTVVAPGIAGFDFCVPDPQLPDDAIQTVVLENYSEISPSGGIHLANLTQRFEPTGDPCVLSTGDRFSNGRLVTNGLLHTFCDVEVAEDCDETLSDLHLTATDLELRLSYERPACDLTVFATGKLFADNASAGETFAQTFLGLTLKDRVVGDRRSMAPNGRVLVDCLGEVEYSTPDELLLEPGRPCPTQGTLRIVIRDPSGDGGLGRESRQGTESVPRAALVNSPNSFSVSGGLHDLSFRAANGQVYQVLQNPAGNLELQTEDVQITTVVGSTDGINECSTISTGQTQAQAVVSAVFGLAFPLQKVFASEIFESASQPCFNPNGRDGDGLLCFGGGCNSVDCRCVSGGCETFSLADLMPLADSDLAGRPVESLSPSDPPCSAGGRATYGLGSDAPTIDPGLCSSRPGDGFRLRPRQSVVIAYDAPPTSEFISGAAGFPVDVGGDSNRCRAAGVVITGVATKNELGRALVTFAGGRVDFDVNDDRVVERSLPSCQLLSAAQCGAPPPTPMPTPNRQCPEFTNIQPQGSTADAFNLIRGASCGDGGNDSPERSFRFRAPEDGCYRIETFGSAFDTLLYVRRGGETCQGPEIACDDNADESTLQSEVFVTLDAGDTAVIVVDGNGGARGEFQLAVERVGALCPEGPTATNTANATPTATATATSTATGTVTPTATRQATLTVTAASPSPTATEAATDTPTPEPTSSATGTRTSTPTPSFTATRSLTPTVTLTPTEAGTATPTPTGIRIQPPPPGTGVVLSIPRLAVPPFTERQACFATYYDFTDQVPAQFRISGGTAFAYDVLRIQHDAELQRVIGRVYTGAATPDNPLWGGFSCVGGAHDGEPCDPLDLGFCGSDALCATAPFETVNCIGFGPGDTNTDARFVISQGGTGIDQELPAGVYGQLPLKGIVLWDVLALNRTSVAVDVGGATAFTFAAPEEQLHALEEVFDTSRFFDVDVLPFEIEEICQHYTLPRGARLFELRSFLTRFGKRYRVFRGAFVCAGGSAEGAPCSPFGSDFGSPQCPGGTCMGPGDPAENLLYTNLVFDEPFIGHFDPPLVFDSELADARTLTYCVLYDNGFIDPQEVKRRTTSPPPPLGLPSCSVPTHCTEGNVGSPCSGSSTSQRDASCDSSPGTGDGFCDACPLRGGVTTEDAFLAFVGDYYSESPSPTPTVTPVISQLGERIFVVDPLASPLTYDAFGPIAAAEVVDGELRLVTGAVDEAGIATLALGGDVVLALRGIGLFSNFTFCIRMLAADSSGSIDCDGGTSHDVRLTAEGGPGAPSPLVEIGVGNDGGPGAASLLVPEQAPKTQQC
jgi:hypothetical protein